MRQALNITARKGVYFFFAFYVTVVKDAIFQVAAEAALVYYLISVPLRADSLLVLHFHYL